MELCPAGIAYAHGMAPMKIASQKYDHGLDPEAVARLWRGGCIRLMHAVQSHGETITPHPLSNQRSCFLLSMIAAKT
jgi:6-phosphogluconate dehydrogenase